MKNSVKIIVIVMLSSMYIQAHQLIATQLHITVRNELGNTEEGASVKLFETEDDYRNETNQVGETQYTDKKGIVKFKNLKGISYFMLVEKDDKNNIGGGVATDKLIESRINKVNVIIE